uniref:Uncharacterized protein n=1 Tax=Daphnia galeata TaxID=27404 RepID=A0A8J2RAN9_9CRUS|nr:unnamed protein product [Daphnia galeata]
MEDMVIPMSLGNMEDIGQDSNILPEIYEREERIVVDYSNLPDKYKHLLVSDEIRREGDLLERRVNELSHTLQHIKAPNMRAVEKFDLAGEKLQGTNTEFEKARAKTKKAQQAFERVKKERFDLFMSCFEHFLNKIDGIYNSLARNNSAQAVLCPENPVESYLDGIDYNCVAPNKRFQPMSSLSGEKRPSRHWHCYSPFTV